MGADQTKQMWVGHNNFPPDCSRRGVRAGSGQSGYDDGATSEPINPDVPIVDNGANGLDGGGWGAIHGRRPSALQPREFAAAGSDAVASQRRGWLDGQRCCQQRGSCRCRRDGGAVATLTSDNPATGRPISTFLARGGVVSGVDASASPALSAGERGRSLAKTEFDGGSLRPG